ncbi:MAG: PQQ-binding-like beta-propeller repeat protein [Planctomycetota bacterium]
MKRYVAGFAYSLLLPALVMSAHGDDWPQFLGASRDGTSSETGLIDSLDDSLEIVWRVRGGVGMSAVAVSDNDAVTTWNAGGKQWLACLDAGTGEQRWATPLAPSYGNSMGDGPRATPAITEDRVFAFTGEGVLIAVTRDNGKELWRVGVFGSGSDKPSEYGMSASPLIVDGKVIVHAGGGKGAVRAFEASSGKPVWSSGSGLAGYSSPTVLNVGGQNQIVCFTAAGVVAMNPESGMELWSYGFRTPYDCNTATPILIDGGVFISAGENHGCVLLDIARRGDRYSVQERWASVDSKSVMRNEWQTSVVVGDYLFGFDNVGSAGPVTHLSCIAAATGKPMWQEKRFGKGNLTLADGKLWITTMKGELVLVRATPRGFEELGRRSLFGKTRQSLSIANGHGYIRDDRDVICVKLSK